MDVPRQRMWEPRYSSPTPLITTSTERTNQGRAANAPSASWRSSPERQKETTMIKRLVFFAYGLAAYAMFLGSFLYAIAFVGDFGVPARLDGPLTGSLSTAL